MQNVAGTCYHLFLTTDQFGKLSWMTHTSGRKVKARRAADLVAVTAAVCGVVAATVVIVIFVRGKVWKNIRHVRCLPSSWVDKFIYLPRHVFVQSCLHPINFSDQLLYSR